MRKYVTKAVEAPKIDEMLNEAGELYDHVKLEQVTGNDFIVYATYSYDTDDEWGWFAYRLGNPHNYLVGRVTINRLKSAGCWEYKLCDSEQEAREEAESRRQELVEDKKNFVNAFNPPAKFVDSRTKFDKFMDRVLGVR